MMVPDFTHDQSDLFLLRSLGRWIAIEWRDGPVNPPQGRPYGTHLAAHTFCASNGEIRSLNWQWFFIDPIGRYVKCCEPLMGIKVQWHFAYTTLKKYRLTVITDEEASVLELSEKIFEAKESAAILAFRQREDLDLFRCPGYPDDLQVLFNSRNEKPEGFEGESAWVRVKDVLNQETFTGSLLNNLVSSPMKADDTITVRLINTGSTRILIGK